MSDNSGGEQLLLKLLQLFRGKGEKSWTSLVTKNCYIYIYI